MVSMLAGTESESSMHSRCCQRSSHHWWIRWVTWSDMKWHEVTWTHVAFHISSQIPGVLLLCLQISYVSWFTRWFSLSKPPVSREESDFLVRRVLLIWKRAMRQFFGRVEDLSESSILSYSFYHSLSMLVQNLLCLEHASSDAQIPLQILFVSAFESRGEPSCETSAS